MQTAKYPQFCLSVILIFFLFHSFTKQTAGISLDGIIDQKEWEGATEHKMAGGAQLLMKKENNELYVALKADKQAWAHVYLSHRDTIRVLHASAALGEARYVKQGGLWRSIQPFTWEMRDRVYNSELEKKQEAYYKRHGWVANNNNTGSGTTLEFKLDLSRVDHNPAPFACALAEVPLKVNHFPASLSDNTILQQLVQGHIPDSLFFAPNTWEQIK